MNGHCNSCKFWLASQKARNWGTCTLITPNSGYSQTSHAELSQPNSGIYLTTRPEFGCTEYKPEESRLRTHSEVRETLQSDLGEFFETVRNAEEI